MLITIEPYASAEGLAPHDLGRVVDTHNRCWDEWIPGEPPLSAEAYLDEDRLTHAPHVVLRRLARDAAGEVVGHGYVEFREGPGACMLTMFVAPDHRRRGVGRALGAGLAAAAREAGRDGITIEVPEGDAVGSICERAGFKRDLLIEQNRTDPRAVSDALLQKWRATGEAAAGYSLVVFDDVCPDDQLASDFIEARHVMNDAPRFEGEPASTFTLAELRAEEAALAAAHTGRWNVGVRHDASGRLVGLSEMYLPRAQPWLVFQGDTGVVHEHRGQRLGAWMKAVNHLRLGAERPEVRAVQTWNASANEPMLNINRALGFRPVQTYLAWYLPFA
jgi:GNAT superfamily N-acetyltransferase